MSAPEGNQFWKLRSKHGRDKLFATPELMWDAACEYFQWVDDNPLMAAEQRKGNMSIPKGLTDEQFKEAIASNMVQLPKMRPYTLHGLCRYLDCNTGYFRDFKAKVKGSELKIDKDFSSVITRIEEIIYEQKFSGAAAGFLNPMIIARDLGIKDQIEQSGTVKNVNYNAEMTADEVKKISEQLEKDV